MIQLPKYSFDVEFKEITYPNIIFEFIPDRKVFTKEEYTFLENSIQNIFLVWREISQYGGFNVVLKDIRGIGFQSYYQYSKKKCAVATYIEENEFNTITNLLHLLEYSYNKYPEYHQQLKISKIKIYSLTCSYDDFISYKRGYL